MIRREAVIRLGWFGKAGSPALAALQRVADGDPDSDVQAAAQRSIEFIKDALAGRHPQEL